MYFSNLGRQPFHGSSSDELVFMVCRGRPDMELVTSAAGAGDVTKLTDVITLLLQSSAKARLVYYTKKCLFFFYYHNKSTLDKNT